MFDYTKPLSLDEQYEARVEQELEETFDEPEPVQEFVAPVAKSEDLKGVATTRLYVREDNSRESAQVTILSKGDEVTVIDEIDGWYLVETRKHEQGYCMSQYIELV